MREISSGEIAIVYGGDDWKSGRVGPSGPNMETFQAPFFNPILFLPSTCVCMINVNSLRVNCSFLLSWRLFSYKSVYLLFILYIYLILWSLRRRIQLQRCPPDLPSLMKVLLILTLWPALNHFNRGGIQ